MDRYTGRFRDTLHRPSVEPPDPEDLYKDSETRVHRGRPNRSISGVGPMILPVGVGQACAVEVHRTGVEEVRSQTSAGGREGRPRGKPRNTTENRLQTVVAPKTRHQRALRRHPCLRQKQHKTTDRSLFLHLLKARERTPSHIDRQSLLRDVDRGRDINNPNKEDPSRRPVPENPDLLVEQKDRGRRRWEEDRGPTEGEGGGRRTGTRQRGREVGGQGPDVETKGRCPGWGTDGDR